MGLLDGFPFVRREERERRRRDLEKRVVPFGAEAQGEKIKETLKELFPREDITSLVFAFYQAKDAYVSEEDAEKKAAAAQRKLNDIRWVDGRMAAILLKFVQLESAITSLDEYPSASDILEEYFL
jgi:CTP synthase (UTP-ammonia lyase)